MGAAERRAHPLQWRVDDFLLGRVGAGSAVVVAAPALERERGTMRRGMLAISLSCSLVRSKLISISSLLMVRCFAMTWIISSRSCSMVPWARPPRSYVNASFRRSFAACLLCCVWPPGERCFMSVSNNPTAFSSAPSALLGLLAFEQACQAFKETFIFFHR